MTKNADMTRSACEWVCVYCCRCFRHMHRRSRMLVSVCECVCKGCSRGLLPIQGVSQNRVCYMLGSVALVLHRSGGCQTATTVSKCSVRLRDLCQVMGGVLS
jgi:hypothetical protein